MDIEAFKMYLQNIEEYVMDEDKIVTYKWLSKTLELHVNTSKQLLFSFAKEQKGNVHLTYLVGGVLRDGSGCKIQVVQEDDLERVKAQFKVLTSEHVYSVQKTKKLPDLNILYAVDSHKTEEDEIVQRLGAIQCSHSFPRPQEEIERLRLKARVATSSADSKQWPTGPSAAKKKPADAASSKDEVGTSGGLKEEQGAKKREVKNTGIAAMFAAQSSKTKKEDGAEGKAKVPEKQTAKPKTAGGISMFFSRQTEKQTKPKAAAESNKNDSSHTALQESKCNGEVEKKEAVEKGGRDQEKHDDISNKKDKVANTIKDSSAKNKNKKESASNTVKDSGTKQTGRKGGRGKSKKSSVDEELQPAKKRKRIKVMSDSEESSDDDIFVKEEEEEDSSFSPAPPEAAPEQPESDDEDVIPPTPEATLKKGRKRVRKLKDQTYMDEDGYLLTRKEYVFESCTDSEVEEASESSRPKENGEKTEEDKSKSSKSIDKEPPAKKKASPQKTKQSSLMSFFKKTS